MSYVKPLAMAAAMALGFIALNAFAATATPTIDINTATVQSSVQSADFYIADFGTPKAHRVYYFTKLDRNHNGELSRAEVPKDMRNLRLHFIEADWDQNGQLSPSEYLLYQRGEAPQYAGVFHAIVFVYHYQ